MDSLVYMKGARGGVGVGVFQIGTLGRPDGIKIMDGTQGAGKVLTSDATGLASWQSVGTGGGSYSVTGSALQTAFVVTHSLGYTPSQVVISPTAAGNALAYYITAKGATTFTVNFVSSPGVVPVSFDWIAKQ